MRHNIYVIDIFNRYLFNSSGFIFYLIALFKIQQYIFYTKHAQLITITFFLFRDGEGWSCYPRNPRILVPNEI